MISNQTILKGSEITISYIDHAHPERIYRQRVLREQYYFDCTCDRCSQEYLAPLSPVVFYTLEECGQEIEDLNSESLKLEKQGKFNSSIAIIEEILLKIAKTPEKFSEMVIRELLERASFLHILSGKFKEAIPLQERLCEINQRLYIDKFKNGSENFLAHPLVGT